jgi:hypothetical protein
MEKKRNLQAPWGMEDLTLPSIGASFKKWECYTFILPKGLAHSLNFQFFFKNDQFIYIKRDIVWWFEGCRCNRRATPGCWPSAVGCPKLTLFKKEILHPAFFFFHMWSILASWFQHMPAQPKLGLKTLNIHNFWSVAPKIMKFVHTRSLFLDTFGFCLNNLKIVWDHAMLPKTGLCPIGTSGPLGIKIQHANIHTNLRVLHTNAIGLRGYRTNFPQKDKVKVH